MILTKASQQRQNIVEIHKKLDCLFFAQKGKIQEFLQRS